LFRNWSFITALLQVGDVALPLAEQVLGDIHADFIERMHLTVEAFPQTNLTGVNGWNTGAGVT
jgi:hypothetical protein